MRTCKLQIFFLMSLQTLQTYFVKLFSEIFLLLFLFWVVGSLRYART